MSTGAELNVFWGHGCPVDSVAISRYGMRILSGSRDDSVRVWDAWMGSKSHMPTGHTDSVHSVPYSRYATHISSLTEDQCQLLITDRLLGV